MSDLLELVAFIDGFTADWRESRARKRAAKRADKRADKRAARRYHKSLPTEHPVSGDPTLVDEQRAAVHLRKINV